MSRFSPFFAPPPRSRRMSASRTPRSSTANNHVRGGGRARLHSLTSLFSFPPTTRSYTYTSALSSPPPSALRSCFKTKQFLTNPAKWGTAGAATNDVYFEKKHPWISEVRLPERNLEPLPPPFLFLSPLLVQARVSNPAFGVSPEPGSGHGAGAISPWAPARLRHPLLPVPRCFNVNVALSLRAGGAPVPHPFPPRPCLYLWGGCRLCRASHADMQTPLFPGIGGKWARRSVV